MSHVSTVGYANNNTPVTTQQVPISDARSVLEVRTTNARSTIEPCGVWSRQERNGIRIGHTSTACVAFARGASWHDAVGWIAMQIREYAMQRSEFNSIRIATSKYDRDRVCA